MSHFNESASSWDSPEKITMMKNLARKVIDIYPDIFSKDKKYDIMDFGAGTGLFGLEFLDFAKSLTAVDTSEAMLDELKSKTKERQDVFTYNIDLESTNLDKSFDIILSSMAFHHLQSPESVMLKFKAMLNPNGKILIIDLCKEDGSFHPDNDKMGVKHHGFAEQEVKKWASHTNMNLNYSIINEIEKNHQIYQQFLAVVDKN
ncbi:MAG: class I SAM-dependent methyltransferase [Bdellovibrionales bacterium]|nr:class I SAM-dependent methyltransferase [Bdellovibrionales bacterium]